MFTAATTDHVEPRSSPTMATLASKRKCDPRDMPELRAAPALKIGGPDFEQQYFHTEGVGMENNMDFGICGSIGATWHRDPESQVELWKRTRMLRIKHSDGSFSKHESERELLQTQGRYGAA